MNTLPPLPVTGSASDNSILERQSSLLPDAGSAFEVHGFFGLGACSAPGGTPDARPELRAHDTVVYRRGEQAVGWLRYPAGARKPARVVLGGRDEHDLRNSPDEFGLPGQQATAIPLSRSDAGHCGWHARMRRRAHRQKLMSVPKTPSGSKTSVAFSRLRYSVTQHSLQHVCPWRM